MAELNHISKKRAYAVASSSSTTVSDVSTASRKIAKERSADELNRMLAEAFATVYK